MLALPLARNLCSEPRFVRIFEKNMPKSYSIIHIPTQEYTYEVSRFPTMNLRCLYNDCMDASLYNVATLHRQRVVLYERGEYWSRPKDFGLKYSHFNQMKNQSSISIFEIFIV